jgi:HK97 gp10 family phage protein
VAKVKVRIEGLRECEAALAELGKAAKGALIHALNRAAKPIVEFAKQKAPRRTGILVTTIKVARRVKRGRKPKADAVVHAGSISPLAHLQEFGTAHHAPQPFMRPAFDAKAPEAVAGFKDELKIAIERKKVQLARRNARLLAKGVK